MKDVMFRNCVIRFIIKKSSVGWQLIYMVELIAYIRKHGEWM